MIAYIKGTVGYINIQESSAVIETGGVGFRIFMPLGDLELLPPEGEQVKVYTYLQIREDAYQLYGFLTLEERRLFELLTGVSGIGPKAGLSILGTLDVNDLKFAVLGDDAKAIARAPGIGLKTAKKLILELKDRLDLEEALESALSGDAGEASGAAKTAGGVLTEAQAQAVEALTSLGYGRTESLRAVRQAEAAPEASVEDILKGALRYIG